MRIICNNVEGQIAFASKSNIVYHTMQLKTGRQTNKAVPLPLEGHAQASIEGSTELVEDIRRSILALAIADGFNLKDTMPVLRAAFPHADLHLISECLHFSIQSEDGEHTEEAYLFDVR